MSHPVTWCWSRNALYVDSVMATLNPVWILYHGNIQDAHNNGLEVIWLFLLCRTWWGSNQTSDNQLTALGPTTGFFIYIGAYVLRTLPKKGTTWNLSFESKPDCFTTGMHHWITFVESLIITDFSAVYLPLVIVWYSLDILWWLQFVFNVLHLKIIKHTFLYNVYRAPIHHAEILWSPKVIWESCVNFVSSCNFSE